MMLYMFMESIADQTDHFADAFVNKNVAYGCDLITMLVSLRMTQFCLEKSSVRKGRLQCSSSVFSAKLVGMGSNMQE